MFNKSRRDAATSARRTVIVKVTAVTFASFYWWQKFLIGTQETYSHTENHTEPFLTNVGPYFECVRWTAKHVNSILDSSILRSLFVPQNFTRDFLQNKSCALVGSSGILARSEFGAEIDHHDVVVRFGLPSLSAELSGLKTDILFLNPGAMKLYPDYRVKILRMNATLLSLNCCELSCYEKAVQLQHALSRSRTIVTAMDCKYLDTIVRALKTTYGWQTPAVVPRTGMLQLFPFLENCNTVDLYGMWPFPKDCDGNDVPYHYWEAEIQGTSMNEYKNNFHDPMGDLKSTMKVIRMSESSHLRIRLPRSACGEDLLLALLTE